MDLSRGQYEFNDEGNDENDPDRCAECFEQGMQSARELDDEEHQPHEAENQERDLGPTAKPSEQTRALVRELRRTGINTGHAVSHDRSRCILCILSAARGRAT